MSPLRERDLFLGMIPTSPWKDLQPGTILYEKNPYSLVAAHLEGNIEIITTIRIADPDTLILELDLLNTLGIPGNSRDPSSATYTHTTIELTKEQFNKERGKFFQPGSLAHREKRFFTTEIEWQE